jgi:hypothetical protein
MSDGIMSIYPRDDADESDEDNDADESAGSVVFVDDLERRGR